VTPDWRRDGPAWFELEDLTGISFEPIHPRATPGIVLPSADRPWRAYERVQRPVTKVLVALAGLAWVGVLVLAWLLGVVVDAVS